MASVQNEVVVAAPPDKVWDAARDVGSIHTRLAPGFVVDTKVVEGERARLVTFGSGASAYEIIVDRDDEARRLVWAVVDSPLGMTHYNASLQIFAGADDGGGSRVVWIADLLPDEAAPRVAEMIAAGLATMKAFMESG